jgi:hypothetical protein
MIVIFKYLFSSKFNGLAIYPFIFLKHKLLKENFRVINHEKIHLKQQLELLWLPFFIWYGIEFAVRLIQFKNTQLAYKNIIFEREAYKNESNLNYLKDRKLFSFLKYLR